jgi:hypothetical protein
MKTIKRWLCLLLAMLMIVGMTAMVSCADEQQKAPDGSENEPTGDETPDEPTEPEVERLPLDLPEGSYGGKEIHFLSYSAEGTVDVGTTWIPWEEIDVEEFAGGTLENVVYDRNATVEELYDVKITNEYISVDQGYSNTLRANHNTGDDAFQVITQRSYEIKALVMENLMTNMFDLPNLHTDMPWWNQDSVSAFTLGSTLFFAAPEMLLRDKAATACVYYNAKVATDNGITDLYDMVGAGEWTFEEFVSLMEETAASLDGDDLMNSHDDLWGSTSGLAQPYLMYGGAGMKYAHTDEDGYLVYDFGVDENTILHLQDIYERYVFNDVVPLNESKATFNPPAGFNLFTSDHALFEPGLVKSLLTYRDMESDFGVLPTPKMDEYQDSYYSLVWVHQDCVLGIPSIAMEKDMITVVLEHMNYLSYYDVYPVFYDTIILGRSPRDEQSREMLELVFRTRLYDPGLFWDHGQGESGLHGNSGFRGIPNHGKNNIASIFATYEKTIAFNFEKLNEFIDDLS